MFYVCSFKESLAEDMMDFLWREMVTNPSSSPEMRLKAVYCIASLMARANFVDVDTVVCFLEMSSNWVHSYIEANEGQDSEKDSPRIDIVKNGLFYGVVQSMMHVIMSKHYMFNPQTLNRLKTMNFQRIIMSRLNPLSICSQTCLNTFASLSRHYQLALCSAVIERNRRLKTSDDSMNQVIEPCFTFEPPKVTPAWSRVSPLFLDTNRRPEVGAIAETPEGNEDGLSEYGSSFSPKNSQWVTRMMMVTSDVSTNDEEDFNMDFSL
jgi:hypothetical protein